MARKKNTQSDKTSQTQDPVAEDVPAVIALPPPPRIILLKGDQFLEPRQNRFFHAPAPVELELPGLVIKPVTVLPIGLTPGLRRLTYDEWCQIAAFHVWSVATFRAETLLDHFILPNGEHYTTPFHQQVTRGAMTISVDYTTSENVELMQRLTAMGINSGDFHGTTHNHVTMSAFASGTDKDDEAFKQGWHFTIGNCDKKPLSVHGRIRIRFSPRFDEDGNRIAKGFSEIYEVSDWSKVIDIPGVDEDMPPELRKQICEYWVTRPKDQGFPEEWKSFVSEKKFTSYSGGGTGHGPARFQGRYYGGHGGYQGQFPTDDDEFYGFPTSGKSSPAASTPGSAAGRNVVTTAKPSAVAKGHHLASGTVEEGRVETVIGGTSISREQYRKYRHELALLEALASSPLSRDEIGKLLSKFEGGGYKEFYSAPSGMLEVACCRLIDSVTDLEALVAAAKNVLDLWNACPLYAWSASPQEHPANRAFLLTHMMAAEEEASVE